LNNKARLLESGACAFVFDIVDKSGVEDACALWNVSFVDYLEDAFFDKACGFSVA
jgi:hypothetical protein